MAQVTAGSVGLDVPVINLTSGGVAVFLLPEASFPALGTEVRVCIRGPGLASPLQTDAHVAYLDRDGPVAMAGLVFGRPAEPAPPNALREIFDRRRTIRVKPRPDEAEIPVRLRCPRSETSATGHLHDLSESGVAVRLPDASSFSEGHPLELRFQLPGESHQTVLFGAVRHVGPDHTVGLEIQHDAGPDFENHRLALVRYVVERNP